MIAIINYFEEQMEIIETNSEAAKSGLDVDVLHDLRVGIKRLKALYQVLDPISEGRFDSKTNFADVHILFKEVGKLREIQVLKALFAFFAKDAAAEIYIEFNNLITAREQLASDELNTALQQFDNKLIGKSLEAANAFLVDISNEDATKLTKKLLKKRFKQLGEMLPN
jgi:hypothetical protein